MGNAVAAADSTAQVKDLRYAGGEYEQAGTAEGKAIGGTISYLGTNALAAGKGYLDAGLEHDINAEIDGAIAGKVPAIPGSPAEASQTIAAGGDGNPAGQFQSETDRLYAAYKQGILSQSGFNLRIGAIVKKYSSIMPGWAPDFRRTAHELVGISGVHDVISGRASGDAQAKADWEFSQKADEAIMSKYGLQNRHDITQEMRATTSNQAQASFALEQLKTKRDATALTEEENNKLAGQQFGLQQANVLIGAQQLYTQFIQENQGVDLTTHQGAEKLRNKLDGYLSTAEATGMVQIDAMMDPKQTKNPITFEQATKFKADLKSSLGTMRENMKSTDAMSLYAGALKDAGGEAKLLQDRLSIANPLITVYKDAGQLPDMIKQYVSMGMDKAAFGKAWGAPAAEAVDKFVNNPYGAKDYATVDTAVRQGKVDLSAIAAASGKDKADLIMTGAVGQVALGKGGEGDFNVLFDAKGSNLNVSTPSGHAALDKMLATGGLTKSLAAMEPAKAEAVAARAFTKADTAQPGVVQIVADLARKTGDTSLKVDVRGRLSTGSGNASMKAAVTAYNDVLALKEAVAPHIQGAPSVAEMRSQGWNAIRAIRAGETTTATDALKAAPEEIVDYMDGVKSGNYQEWVDQGQAVQRQQAVDQQVPPGGPTPHRQMEGNTGEPVTSPIARTQANAAQQGDVRRNEIAAAPSPETMASIRKLESGGNDSAKNPNSSASGAFQVINSTWNRFKNAAAEKLGVKPEELSKTNPEHSAAVAALNIQAGKAKLGDLGFTHISPVDEYSLHVFGDGAGPKVVAARDEMSLAKLVGEAAMKANKWPLSMTVGEWREKFAKKMYKAPTTTGVKG